MTDAAAFCATRTARSGPNSSNASATAIERGDAAALRQLAGELHEADTGDLIEALDPELRPALRRADGPRIRLSRRSPRSRRRSARKSSRRCRPKTVAEGVRELDSDDAAHILEDLPERGAGRDPRADAAARARRGRAHPALSGGLRRPPHADRVHRRAAVLDGRRRHRPHARDRRPAGPLLRALRGRRRAASFWARSRSTGCCAPSGRCRSPS